MGEFRTRRFVPVEPWLRPRRHRQAARVIVTDGARALLFFDTDPGAPESLWLTTPGGGMDAGESPSQAAVREVFEETGLRITEHDLLGPVLTRTVIHGYSDQILSQDEVFFIVRTAPFEVNSGGLTPSEQITMSGHAWVPLDELEGDVRAGTDVPVWPAGLAGIVRSEPSTWPFVLGEVEESILPV